MQTADEMFAANKKYQDRNLKIGIKRISENGGKNVIAGM